MEITFLGTSCMVPTKDRNVAGVFLKYKEEGILFDCGEGTQRQMNICGINRNDVTRICVSHWHGDHVSGIIGLIQTVGNSADEKVLHIYGPMGTKMRMEHLMLSCIFENKVDIRITELSPKGVERFFENEEIAIECAPMKHSVACNAYSFIVKDKFNIDPAQLKKHNIKPGPHLQKIKDGETIVYEGKKFTPAMLTVPVAGKKVTYITDTRPNKFCAQIADGADVLVIDATYANDLADKADQYGHLTAKESAQIASAAGVKKLALTHFSQRYKSTHEIESDARTVFDNVICAKDFMRVNV